MEFLSSIVSWFWNHKLILVATCILLIELILRYGAPRSVVYAKWSALFVAIGKIWTVVLLSIIYLLSVGPVGLTMRALGKDFLDKSLRAEPTFWRRHEPGPLAPDAAARHQF